MRAHRRRWRLWRAFAVAGAPWCCPEPLRQPNQCLPPHPSSFVFSGFECAKRQRLCRPSGNLLGMNPAGVLLFRMRAHRRRWRLWGAFGVAGGPRCCPEPLRQPNQCLPPHPSSFVFSGFEGAKRQRLCRPSGNPLGMNPAGVLPFRMRAHRRRWRLWRAFGVAGAHGAAQSRYVNPTNACHPTHPALFLAGSKVPNGALPTKWQPVGPESCWGSAVSHACSPATRLVAHGAANQCLPPHPSSFVFSGFECAKRQRLCRPSGNPLGMNPAGVLLFRRRWRLWRAFGVAGGPRCCPEPLRQPNQCLPPHPSSFVFSGFEGAKRQRLCRPSGNPLGMNPAGVLLFRMRAHRRRWRLWRAFGVAGGPRCCPEPLRQPNQCLPPHPSSFVFSGFEGAKRQRLCRPSGNPLGMNPAGVLLFRMRAHRRRWRLWRAFGVAGAPWCCPEPLRQPNQCLPPHPSSFVFSGFEGAKRQRLCRPSGNLLGMNPAGVLLFRMRAHRRRWRLWRAFGVAGGPRCCPEPLRQPNQCLPPHRFEGAKRQRLCRPSGNPLGMNPAGVLLFRMRAHRRRWRLWRAFGVAGAPRCCPEPLRLPNQCLPPHPSSCVFSGFEGAKRRSADQVATRWAWILLGFCSFACVLIGDAGGCDVPLEWLVPHGAAQSRYVNLTNACHPTHPALFLAGSKVPNGSGSADQVATCWAWILLGFCCFACVLTGDAGGCDVPLEWLVAHGAAQSRYVNPTNASHQYLDIYLQKILKLLFEFLYPSDIFLSRPSHVWTYWRPPLTWFFQLFESGERFESWTV